jgi:hypothetical protein
MIVYVVIAIIVCYSIYYFSNKSVKDDSLMLEMAKNEKQFQQTIELKQLEIKKLELESKSCEDNNFHTFEAVYDEITTRPEINDALFKIVNKTLDPNGALERLSNYEKRYVKHVCTKCGKSSKDVPQ